MRKCFQAAVHAQAASAAPASAKPLTVGGRLPCALLQVDALCDEHHVYLTRNGRISMAGVNPSNVERLAKAIHMVTTGQKEGSERSGWYHAAA